MMGRTIILLASLVAVTGCVTEQTFLDSKKQVRSLEFDKQDAAKTRLILGLSYLENNKYEQAKFNLEKALEFAPERADVNYSVGYYYQMVGEMDQAESYYLKAIKLEPENPDTLNNYGTFLCNVSQVDKAEEYFQKAINISKYTRAAESYENMAICALDNKQFVKADKYFEMSYKHNPGRASAVLSLSGLKYAMGDLVAALDFLNRYNRLRQRSGRGALLGYILETKRGRITQANQYASQLTGEFANSREALYFNAKDVRNSEFEKLKRDYKNQTMGTAGTRPQIKITRKNPVKGQTSSVPDRRRSLAAPSALTAAVKSVSEYNQEIQEKVDMFSAPLTDTEKVRLPQQEESMVTLAKDTPLPQEQVLVQEITPAEVVNDRALTDKENAYLKVDKALLTLPTHKVVDGDNLFRISTKYNIKITSLIFWNKLDKEELSAGQTLLVADPNSILQVEKDTLLSDLAKEQGIELESLLSWNQLEKDGWLKSGGKLRLIAPPGFKKAKKQAPVVAKADEYLELKPLPIIVPTHTIVDGEFLYKISRKYNIKIAALMKWNKLKSESDIKVGQQLFVANPNIYYVVKNGGKLSDVANKLNIDLSKLKAWNQVQHDGRLKKGTQVLVVDVKRYE